MNGTDLLARLKEDSGTENFDNISDDKYYKWLSDSHKFIAEYIKARVDSKFFMGIAQANLVLGQNIYDSLGYDETTGRTINVIDSLYIKYDGSSFVKATPQDLTELPESREYYEENQPAEKPFYTVTNDKVLIFPTPTDDVNDGIELIGSRNVGDITSDTLEAEIFNGTLFDYHYLISKGAVQYVLSYIKDREGAKLSRNEFLYEDLERLRAEVSYRNSQPVPYEEPDFTGLLS